MHPGIMECILPELDALIECVYAGNVEKGFYDDFEASDVALHFGHLTLVAIPE